MSDFNELMLPSHVNEVTLEFWYVEAVQTSQFLLNHTIDLGTMAEPIESFYFSTEVNALESTYQYYASHLEPFPYFNQWADAIKNATYAGTATKSSQIMRFI